MIPWLFQLLLLLLFLAALDAAGQSTNSQPAGPGKSESSRAGFRKVDINEFEKLWRNKTNIVLDVRTPKEFADGHIPGAINLDYHASDFQQKIAALTRDKTYLVHCAAGVRSARACDQMRELGFTNLVDLPSGFRAWEKAGKPVEK